jgi:hypothetical protein
MPRFEENEILMEELNSFELIESDDFKFAVLASKKKDDDEDNDADDDDFIEDEEEEVVEENPFDKEPTEQDIVENNIPLIDPEDDLLDEDEEIPYN